MKRFLIAAVMGVLAAGCAEGIDDPQPGPDPTASQSDGNEHQFSAELPDTHIDPAKIGTGVATPKENLTYDNPTAHPGWVGEKISETNLLDNDKLNVEHSFEAQQLEVVNDVRDRE